MCHMCFFVLDYTKHRKQECAGTENLWIGDDGVNYAPLAFVHKCEMLCKENTECGGFNYDTNLNECTFWVKASGLAVKLQDSSTSICYEKKQGMTLFLIANFKTGYKKFLRLHSKILGARIFWTNCCKVKLQTSLEQLFANSY
jgi:hypothetical protein